MVTETHVSWLQFFEAARRDKPTGFQRNSHFRAFSVTSMFTVSPVTRSTPALWRTV